MERKYHEHRLRPQKNVPTPRRRSDDRRRFGEGIDEAREEAPDAVFVCARCGASVSHLSYGTRERNHCPKCLWSLHVDIAVGDRRSLCRGEMEPISLWSRGDGDAAILHRCSRCGTIKSNRVAGDDDEQALRQVASGAWSAVEHGKRRSQRLYYS